MRFIRRGALPGAALVVALAASTVLGQGSTADEIAKYRAALQDGNPAELWEARGADLWRQKRGPKGASLEQCDLGLGAGVVKGAYAQLPKYFADADRVMDLETRIVWCMVTQQGFSDAGAETQIALLERRILRATLLAPEIGATRLPELGRIAILQGGTVLRDFVHGAALADHGRCD
jgi:hypothetical protein